jgi:hypothetical protein
MGIKVAGALGLKVPTPDQLTAIATGKLNPVLQGAQRVLTKVEAGAAGVVKTAESVETVLTKIDWLL